MWRVGITKKDGTVIAKNFDTKEEAEFWVLEQAEKGIKRSIIVDKENIKERFITNWEEEKDEN